MRLPGIAVTCAVTLALAAGCGRKGPPPLPEIPRVTAPLALSVVNPAPGAMLEPGMAWVSGSAATGGARVRVNGEPVQVRPNGAWIAYVPVPAASAPYFDVEAEAGGRRARVRRSVRIAAPAADSTPPADSAAAEQDGAAGEGGAMERWVTLGAQGAAGPVVARPMPGGTSHWLLLPGTVARAGETRAGFVRLRLAAGVDAWVRAVDVRPAAAPPAPAVVSAARVRAEPRGAALFLSIPQPPPFRVEEDGDALVLTLYGATGDLDLVSLAPGDTLVRAVEWAQDAADRLRLTLRLAAPPAGWSVEWAGGELAVRVRRAPAGGSLEGVVVAVDAGHPPFGATGPTGLTESEVTLDVARRLRDLLEARGARVVMTRTGAGPVSLEARVAAAERAGAGALVSIHADAPPAGAEPYALAGSSTRYFHPHSLPLARAVQRGIAARVGVPDRGVAFQDLALARPSGFPAVLCEGATLAIPEHEAALRTPAFRQAWARGIADGVESYFTGPRGR